MALGKNMKYVYLDLLFKVACSIAGFFAIASVAIYKRLDTSLDDKIYPLVLTISIIFLHWLIGLPASFKKGIKKEKIQRKSGWRYFVSFAYLFLVLSIFNQYMSPVYAEAAMGISYTLKLMAIGLIGQMAYVTRQLISAKYKEEIA
jgi:membrane protease YdiL (CAAX protease family)